MRIVTSVTRSHLVSINSVVVLQTLSNATAVVVTLSNATAVAVHVPVVLRWVDLWEGIIR